MRARLDLLSLVFGLFRLALRSRADLVAENLLLRQQPAVLTRPTQMHPRLRTRDKLFWVLVRASWREWRRHLVPVRPETVVGRQRRGWRLLSGGQSRGRRGRPRLDAETRARLARMARESPAWDSERIRGELLKLGSAVSQRSVQRSRGRGPARPPSQPWRTSLANQARRLRATEVSAMADAGVAAILRAVVQRPPAACAPAAAQDDELDRSALAAAG